MVLNANQHDSIMSMWNYLSIHQLQELRKLFLNTYQLHHLKKRSSFKEIDFESWRMFMEKGRDLVDGKIHDDEEFEKVVHDFFHAVSTHPGYMNWTDLLNSFITSIPSRKKNALPIYHGGRYLKQHTKHEMIKKIICIKSGKTCVYIITSKHGCTGIYDEKFRLQKKYKIDIDSDPNSDFAAGSTDPGWITDAIWMGSSKHIVYSTSLRTMHFFDASASTHYEEYRAYGIKSIPTCMSFVEDYDGPESHDILFFGDDSGGLTIVKFHQPKNALFFKDEVSSVQCIFWPDK